MSGQIRLAAAVEDLTTHKTTSTPEASAEQGQELVVVNAIARQLAAEARPFSTGNVQALQLYIDGLRTSDPALLEKALAVDANFGLAYIAGARLALARSDAAGAESIIRRGLERGEQIAAVERAQLQLLDANLKGDTAIRAKAAAELARALPSDAGAAVAASQLAVAARDYPSGVEWQSRALKIEPDNAELWNQLGYAEAYNRNLEGARTALLEYGRRTPNNPNAFDSLGEVHYRLGDFEGAEKYFLEAARMNASFLGGATLWKAAHARLMTGDVQGADKIVNAFFELLQKNKDQLLEYRKSYWDYISGRRDEALARVPSGPARSFLHVQRAVWMVERGDRGQASSEAKAAFASAQIPQAKAMARLVGFVSQPAASPAEWNTRAAREGGEPGQRIGTAYALLFEKRFREAVPLLENLWKATAPPADAAAGFFLAWALIGAGQPLEAAAHLNTYPIPQAGVDVFGSLIIPRIFSLQAGVLDKQGKVQDAAAKRAISRKLGGG